MGLGYIIGVRYAAIICAGSVLSFWVLVPLVARIGAQVQGGLLPGLPPVAGMDAEEIFGNYVRLIGIGGIFAAGLISILKMSPVIVQALRTVLGELRRLGKGGAGVEAVRTERDIPHGAGGRASPPSPRSPSGCTSASWCSPACRARPARR